MRAEPIVVAALGAGRWRILLDLSSADLPLPRADAVTLHAGSPGRIETFVVERRTPTTRLSATIALPPQGRSGTADAGVELHGEGWRASVQLTPTQEPSRAPLDHLPRPLPAAIDFESRDFDALRAMLLAVVDERSGVSLADHPVAQTTALIELLAYLGDALSYQQDALATEAYLATARRRISVVRHAALLDYAVFPGRSARTWVRFDVSQALRLPAGTPVLTRTAGDDPVRLDPKALNAALAAGAQVFETLESVDLTPDERRYELDPHTHPGGTVRPGAVTVTLSGRGVGLVDGQLVSIEPADSASSIGSSQVVRLTAVRRRRTMTTITWAAADALTDQDVEPRPRLCVRAGNLVLVEHGSSKPWAMLPAPESDRRYWPVLPASGPSFSSGPPRGVSAAEEVAPSNARPLAAIELRELTYPGTIPWTLQETLLESGPLDASYVAEIETDGSVRLRFGDGTNGRRPAAKSRFVARCKIGAGEIGNVGRGALSRFVSADDRILAVHNPVAAVGGAEPESLDSVRVNAPRAFRVTERAVTAPEYAAVALAVEGVTDATAVVVPGASGPVARVRVFTGAWHGSSAAVLRRVRLAVDARRPIGVALDVRGAIPRPVTIELVVAVRADWALAAAAQGISEALRGALLREESFGFGVPLYRSTLVRLLTGLPGVADVEVPRFAWTGDPPDAPQLDVLEPPIGRIIRIDDDVSAPEHGSVSFRLRVAE